MRGPELKTMGGPTYIYFFFGEKFKLLNFFFFFGPRVGPGPLRPPLGPSLLKCVKLVRVKLRL